MVMIGILPTLTSELLTHEAISSNPRYALLDQQMLLARGEDLHISISGGPESLETWADSIAICTLSKAALNFGAMVPAENSQPPREIGPINAARSKVIITG